MTPLSYARTFIGLKEVIGPQSNPKILAMLRLDDNWPKDDETPWCSAFAKQVAHDCEYERSKSLAARSWLNVGIPVERKDVVAGETVVILQRGGGKQPGPDVISAPGHVGFVAGFENGKVQVLGGNQGDSVNIVSFPESRVLGYRKLRPLKAVPVVQST